MELNISDFVSFSATAVNVLLFLSGIQVIRAVCKQRSTKGYFVLPFTSCFVCCTLWAKYGLLINDSIVIFVNLAGSIIEGIYTAIFYVYSKKKSNILGIIFGMFLFLFSMLGYTKYITVEGPQAIYHHGVICSAFNVFNYAAPLSATTSVIRRKSTENLSFVLSFLYFLCALLWYFYGVIYNDYFIKIPNFVGIIFGACQLSLFIIYPSSKSKTLKHDELMSKVERG